MELGLCYQDTWCTLRADCEKIVDDMQEIGLIEHSKFFKRKLLTVRY